MALSLRDEIDAMLKHNLEQTPGWHNMTTGQAPLTQQAVVSAVAVMIGAHRDALLRIASEIDALRDSAGEA